MRLEVGWGSERQTFKVEKKKLSTAPGQVKLNVAFSGNPALKPEKKPDNAPKTELDYLKENLEAQKKGAAMKALESKMKGGKKLTPDELDYLREHCPDLYEKYLKIAREREAYKQELEKAQSKEEVMKIHENKAKQFLTEAKAIETSNLSKEEKKGAMEDLMMRVNGVFNEYYAFLQTDEYQQLPAKADEKKDNDGDEQPKMPKEEKKEMEVSGGLGELPSEVDGNISLPDTTTGAADDTVQQLDDIFAGFTGSSTGSVSAKTGESGAGEVHFQANTPASTGVSGGSVDLKV